MLRTVFRAAPAALFLSVPASSFSALSSKPPTPAKMPDSGEGVCKLDEYRGANHWKGLIPSVTEPRAWDEGFRSFLLKYGMFNHVVYDVFIKGEDDVKSEETGLRGMSRFGENLTAFSEKGLKFKSVSLPRALALSLAPLPLEVLTFRSELSHNVFLASSTAVPLDGSVLSCLPHAFKQGSCDGFLLVAGRCQSRG
ncbi:unnamed protein product [Ectocarpus sp. 12 AP-2014]